MFWKIPYLNPNPQQWLSAVQGSCTENSDFKATGAPTASSLLFLIRLITKVGGWQSLPSQLPAATPHEWQAGADVPA